MKTLRREIHPVVKVIDEKQGIVEYVASDESIDSYGEIVRASGADFSRFKKNAPFVDSHNYESIGCCLGEVVGYGVQGNTVVETVKWAIGMFPEPGLADWGFRMTAAGFLKAVSIGFIPTKYVTKWDNNPSAFNECLEDLSVSAGSNVSCVYLTWLQLELSACCIGANGNAVAKAYKAGVLSDGDLDKISLEYSKRLIANPTDGPAAVALARQRERQRFLVKMQLAINQL